MVGNLMLCQSSGTVELLDFTDFSEISLTGRECC